MAIGKVPGQGEVEGFEDDAVFADINITPLTDIFLVLLIIFMVTSSVIVRAPDAGNARAGLKVNLPKGGAADVLPSQRDLAVAVLSDGRIALGGDVITLDELKKAFNQAKEKDPNVLVIVQGDEGVPHGKVVEVMDLAKSAGLAQLAIGVRQARP